MNSNSTLISIGQFDLKLNHLLIISILALSFSISFLLRSQAAGFGFELHEFDPFFNFRATEYVLDNGFDAYFEWNDALSWYPYGRDVSNTSQVVLHFTTAITYSIFGGGSELYDFTIVFPVVIGSLTGVVLFALVRVIGGTTAGLFSALLFSISLPILLRGPIGWFKSEPLGLFFGLLAVYLLLSGINSKNKKIIVPKLVGAGILTTLSISAWGGTQFFIVPIAIFFLALPFIRTDHKFLIWTIPLYTIVSLLTSLGLERTSISFVFGLGGLSLIFSTLFLISCILIQLKSSKNKTRNGLLFLIGILVLVPIIFVIGSDNQLLPTPSHRYMNAINPFLTTTDPLADSVSEHATTTLTQSFLFHSVLMIFSGIGIWLIIKNMQDGTSNFIKNDMYVFALILGMIGVYVSSTFVRLEVFASIGVIILASLGLTILSREFLKNYNSEKKSHPKMFKLPYVAGIILLLVIPMIFPLDGNIFAVSNAPPTILNGGSTFRVATTDWLDSLEWIKNNTPKDAVIASWWDYGYWISTMAERATLADNSTLNTKLIQNIANMLLQHPDEAWKTLNEMEADYVLVFVAGERLTIDVNGQPLYVLRNGGDESKKQWFMRIAGLPLNQYLHNDGSSGTSYFWNETLLGKMFPFTPVIYVNGNGQQSETYQPGFTPVYVKDIKFPIDGNGPLKLVYASPSFNVEKGGPMLGVFVYEVNKDYVLEN
ncbi:dolichyl-diphosphooligosaccharide--protein glycosyltransferase [Marine Group I thaumarchaeote SCGC AAA799-E16]|uniref:dolichyl-phosphooligosaccharide-protein glycotransferase n=2 Tax=Marine Group I TaxID=905826 RepID=A0A087S4C6_9ARCH|nr:dolichyl-diphosphooligosaccharide--protein glycosyltransferase [Marine Group I thaumarchaeote SCGC AAA799-E16]KFM20580.1 dolichyl-diphosphooligosaccharide--protein glycosyltransferase [Marine Group I thaumarchaeote SCGC RSA3]